MQIAQEILRQLGGQGRLKAMIAAKNFVAVSAGNQPANGLQFQFMKGKDGVNMVVIRLNGDDLYDVEFLAVRGVKFRPVAVRNNLFFDQLEAAFWDIAGLAIRLPRVVGVNA